MTSDEQNKIELIPGDEGRLLDHDYDGIRELDHPLPRWWLMIFYTTMVFGFGYAGYDLSGSGPTLKEELAVAMKAIEARHPPPTAPGAAVDEGPLLAVLHDQQRVANGQGVYIGKCAACHGAKGEGGIGPNLTDDHWIHGQGHPKDIAGTIQKGVAEKGMPSWEGLLKSDELIDVTAFIRSVHGTNPPGAKAAQGELREFKEP
jgi:cytochrome c oxidase cbb3-type subunit 3